MEWKEFTIKTLSQAEDLVINMLYENDITSVEIVDNVPLTEEEKQAMYIDIEAELDTADDTALVRFYIDNDVNENEILNNVRAGLLELRDWMDIGEGIILESVTKEEDWINNWKEFFHSFYLEDILIKPSWEEVPEGAEYSALVEIDPKTSFGTGHHETTKLCIRGLRKVLNKGDKVLDLGTGSGILSIIALKLGAGSCLGTDIDPICEEASLENMEMNHITASDFSIKIGNLIGDEDFLREVGIEEYDLVLANILADVIIPMADNAYRTVKKGGYFVTSGIIDFKKDSVIEALTGVGFKIVEELYDGEWVGLIAQK